jgi:hypothetical protein
MAKPDESFSERPQTILTNWAAKGATTREPGTAASLRISYKARSQDIALKRANVMWNLYSSIAIGGVLLMAAPPKELRENDTIVHRVAFLLTWPMYVLIDWTLEHRRNRRKR